MLPSHFSLKIRSAAVLALVTAGCAVASLLAQPTAIANNLSAQISSLQAQESQLQSQLQQLRNEASQAGQQAALTAQQIVVLQQQLAKAQAQLEADNNALALTNDQLVATQAKIRQDRAQLSSLVLALYQRNTGNDLTTALVDSSGVSQFMDASLALQTLRTQFSQLTEQLVYEENRLQTLRAQQQAQQKAVAAQVISLQNTEAQLQTEEANYQQQQANLSAQAQQTANNIQSENNHVSQLQAQLALEQEQQASGAGPGVAGNASLQYGSGVQVLGYQYTSPIQPNHFYGGQCTWYVASRVYVPWFGNADQWAAAAAADGYAEGSTPRVGSIVVWAAGGLYDPNYGHVAYVVGVQGPSQFTVDEANFFDIPYLVDQREITSLSGVEAFIYP